MAGHSSVGQPWVVMSGPGPGGDVVVDRPQHLHRDLVRSSGLLESGSSAGTEVADQLVGVVVLPALVRAALV
jgi:hypothetical protein